MHVDPKARRLRRQLLEGVMTLASGRAELVHHVERGWASVTFAGTRHTLVLAFAGAEAVAAGEHLIAVLSEHEFAIPGQLVADATVVSAEHSTLPEPKLVVETDFLLLDDA